MIIRTPKDLGHLVRDYRSQRSVTQAQLAKLVGASRKWIVDLEAGKRTADLSLVLRTLKALGLDLNVRDRADRQSGGASDVDDIVEQSKRSAR